LKLLLQRTGILAAILAVGNIIAYKIVHIPEQLEVVALITLILLYPIIRRPIIGLYAIFILMPFISHIRRLYYLMYTRPDSDPLIMLIDILVVLVTAGLFLEFKEQKSQGTMRSPFTTTVIIYFFYILARTFILNIKPTAEAVLLFKFYGPAVIIFFSGLIFGSAIKHIKALWIITVSIGTLSAFYAIKQLHFGYSEAEMIWFSSIEFSTLIIKGVARPFSFFQAPVVLADYLQLALIGLLMMITWEKSRMRFLYILSIPILSYAILITSVRSSWIGFIATFLLWALFLFVKKPGQRILIIVLLAGFHFGYNFFADKQEAESSIPAIAKLTSSLSKDNEVIDMLVTDRAAAIYNVLNEHSMLSRFGLWKQLFDYSLEPINGLFGRGTGALKADSLYFTYLAEFGYPGIIFIIVLLTSFIAVGFKIIDTSDDPDIRALITGITIMNIIFFFISITGTHIHYQLPDIYFWFFNGVLVHHSIKMKMMNRAKQMENYL